MDWTIISLAACNVGLIGACLSLGAVKLGPSIAAWGSHQLAMFFDEDYRWDYEERRYWEKRGE